MASSPPRREWLSACVRNEPEIRIAGTAATFAFLRSMMQETSGDIALIDLETSAESAIAREWLSELLDLTPVVLLSPELDTQAIALIRRAGAGAMLQSDASPEQIVQAIKSVAADLMVFDRALGAPNSDEQLLADQLTPRELEVLQLLADGLGNKEIALKLNISEHTIKFHTRSILGKLGATSRTEAVTRGLRSGLIEL